jgi:hypothetical protein
LSVLPPGPSLPTETAAKIRVPNFNIGETPRIGFRFKIPILALGLNRGFRQITIDLIALDEALWKLEVLHPENALVVKLKFFAGCSLEQTAENQGYESREGELKRRMRRDA